MTVQQMTNEEYVRAHWEECEHRDTALGVLAGPHYIIIGNPHRKGWRTFYGKSEPEAWAAAAEFTRERLEQIEMAQWCVMVLEIHLGELDGDSRKAAYVAILEREKSALADLKRGMKP